MSSTSKIIALNAELNDIIEFRYQEEVDENGNPIAAGAAGLGIGAGVGGGALYLRGRGMQGPVRSGAMGVMDTMQQGGQGFANDFQGARDRASGLFGQGKEQVQAARGKAAGIMERGAQLGDRAKWYAGGLKRDAAEGLNKFRSYRAGGKQLGAGMFDSLKAGAKTFGKKVMTRRFSAKGRIIELNAALRDVIKFNR